MSEEVQNKLLRALQEKEGRRVGSNESYEVDLLFVSAANEPNDIGSEPLRGRIAGIEIRMPTLLQRGEEIFLLVNKILERIGSNPADEYRFPLAAWCQTQVAHLTSNVRSLESLVLRQVYHFSNPSIELPDPKLDAFLSACRKVRDSGENPTLKNVGKALSYNGKKSFSKSHVSTAFRKECDVARAMGLLPPGRKRG
jgi:DNA-binding NtrC family response regulator